MSTRWDDFLADEGNNENDDDDDDGDDDCCVQSDGKYDHREVKKKLKMKLKKTVSIYNNNNNYSQKTFCSFILGLLQDDTIHV